MDDQGELVLVMGSAGCSVRFFRRPVAGGFLFHEEVAMASGVDEDGGLVWKHTASDPVPSFGELLPHVRGWLMLSPVRVHPDHAMPVWRLVQEVAEQVSGPTRDLLRARLDRWRQVCGQAAD